MRKLKQQSTPSILLTDLEAAQLLRISSKHFRNLVSEGQMPLPVRLGRSVRWKRTDIESWLSIEPAAIDATPLGGVLADGIKQVLSRVRRQEDTHE